MISLLRISSPLTQISKSIDGWIFTQYFMDGIPTNETFRNETDRSWMLFTLMTLGGKSKSVTFLSRSSKLRHVSYSFFFSSSILALISAEASFVVRGVSPSILWNSEGTSSRFDEGLRVALAGFFFLHLFVSLLSKE